MIGGGSRPPKPRSCRPGTHRMRQIRIYATQVVLNNYAETTVAADTGALSVAARLTTRCGCSLRSFVAVHGATRNAVLSYQGLVGGIADSLLSVNCLELMAARLGASSRICRASCGTHLSAVGPAKQHQGSLQYFPCRKYGLAWPAGAAGPSAVQHSRGGGGVWSGRLVDVKPRPATPSTPGLGWSREIATQAFDFVGRLTLRRR